MDRLEGRSFAFTHYDAQRGGADFLLIKQVLRTMKKTNMDCGVVVHNEKLENRKGVWFVPRELFLLML